MPYLEIHDEGSGDSQLREINKNRFLLGRGENADLQIEDPKASRPHCEIILESISTQLKDLNSSNGTYVNGEKVKSRELSSGDKIRIGGTQLTYHRTKPIQKKEDNSKPKRDSQIQIALSRDEHNSNSSSVVFPTTVVSLVTGILIFLGGAGFILPYISKSFDQKKGKVSTPENSLIQTNFSFEAPPEDQEQFVPGWKINTNLKRIKARRSHYNPAHGNYSLQIKPDPHYTPGPDSYVAVRYRKQFSIKGGALLHLNARIRTTKQDGLVGMRIGWIHDRDLLFHSYSRLIKSSRGWKKITGNFSPPSSATGFYLEAICLGSFKRTNFDRVFLAWDTRKTTSNSLRTLKSGPVKLTVTNKGEITLGSSFEDLLKYGYILAKDPGKTRFDQQHLHTYSISNSGENSCTVDGFLWDLVRKTNISFTQDLSRTSKKLRVSYSLSSPPENMTTLRFRAIVPATVSDQPIQVKLASSQEVETLKADTGWTRKIDELKLPSSNTSIWIRFSPRVDARLNNMTSGDRELILGIPFGGTFSDKNATFDMTLYRK